MDRLAEPHSGQPDSILELIGYTYDAAEDEALWPGLASRLAQVFHSSSAAIVELLDTAPRFVSRTPDVADNRASDYEAWCRGSAGWPKAANGKSPGRSPVAGAGNGPPALAAIEFGAAGRSAAEKLRGIGAVLPIVRGPIAVIGVHRPRSARSYDELEKARLGAFLPHLRRALNLRRRLVQREIAAHAALDQLDRTHTATILADRSGHILYANPAAEALLRVADGLCTVNGRVAPSRRADGDRLGQLICAAVDGMNGEAGGTLSIARDVGSPLTVLVSPVRPQENPRAAGTSAAILQIRELEIRPLARGPLQSLFGLTAAEAAIAGALATGRPLDEIAACSGISRHTARVHLRNIFGKTGTTRQPQLVALLLRSVAVMASRV